MGCRYDGIYRLCKNQKGGMSILHLTQKNGLTSGFIRGIKEDKKGNIWIASYHNLVKLIPKGDSFHIFNFSKANNFYSGITGIEPDAENDDILWLATNDGIIKIKDGELEKMPPLPVYITRVNVPDSIYRFRQIKIQLDHSPKYIQFEFTSPGYINEKQVLYSYRLQGSSVSEWSPPENNHTVSFADMHAGKYRFEVRAMGWNSLWGQPAAIDFDIAPPYWHTWWFYTIAAFLTTLAIYAFFKWRIKNIRAMELEKLKVQQLNADQYKSQLEFEQIINYFSYSLIDKTSVDDVLWDVAKNLIGRLGFIDCMIYLWNDEKTKMIQKAGFGPKGSVEEIKKQQFDVLPGQGVVGFVMETKEPLIISDTTKDFRYRPDEMNRLSEITVPVIYNNILIGIIDSEHSSKNFFTQRHLQILNTIATLIANKIRSIEAEQLLLRSKIEMYGINEQLLEAKLEALRSQMNPHFIFNCLNSIDALIHSNDKYNATTYLNKFAKLLRNILDSSRKDKIAFSKDIETLKLYIELESLRYENKFKAIFSIDEELINSDYKVPPLIIQPFVENAILHGLKNKEGNKGLLSIDIKNINNQIQYIITDNGIGRMAASKIMHNKESHYGLHISSERIKLFNKEEESSLVISDLYEDNFPLGTCVTIKLNIL